MLARPWEPGEYKSPPQALVTLMSSSPPDPQERARPTGAQLQAACFQRRQAGPQVCQVDWVQSHGSSFKDEWPQLAASPSLDDDAKEGHVLFLLMTKGCLSVIRLQMQFYSGTQTEIWEQTKQPVKSLQGV